MEQQSAYVIGQLVQAKVRTGIYIGEVYEIYSPRLVVKILAVIKHPDQGDLHNPNEPDVAMFHERRALSYTEKTTVLPRDVQPYSGSIPDYKESLLIAAHQQLNQLHKLNQWTGKSLVILKELLQDYEK
ncbi:kinase-associated lipoprotein B [Paenibacillus endoradicis]|uniref:kinase-associated lipoprotein B n=1 Tax=Paenibacillus endoradicis TaxID=2972487 RepID=UPI002158EEA9|nr:kinase-associated lipoprotein B [Paenibacillus endoradicis]MCR8659535.1 kinase-associated lipoprotein B [Paenibacillus endoradicis]